MSIDDKTQAEIDKLKAETALLKAQADYREALERERISAEIAQMHQRMKWYVPVLISTGTAGLLTLAILIARFLLVEYPK